MKQTPTIPVVRRKLLTWFRTHRRDLPWRQTRDPYLIAVSEVMLQQTQVDRVKPKYLAWRRAWPTTQSLARAKLHDVLKLWSGLGYNSRGKRLRDAAREVMQKYHGHWPKQIDELEALPGFGPYTARAVASFADNRDVAVIDTNIRRVLSRIFFGLKKAKSRDLDDLAQQLVPIGKSRDWHSALMDFGSAICTSRAPKCVTCPMQRYCRAYPAILQVEPAPKKASVKFQNTDRYWRGAIMRQFIAQSRWTQTALIANLRKSELVDKSRVVRLIGDLIRDELLVQQGRRIAIAS